MTPLDHALGYLRSKYCVDSNSIETLSLVSLDNTTWLHYTIRQGEPDPEWSIKKIGALCIHTDEFTDKVSISDYELRLD